MGPRPAFLAAALCLVVGCHSKPPYQGKTAAQLKEMLQDPRPAVQAQGAFGLSQLGAGAEQAIPELIECLKKETPVRQNAALALGAIGAAASEAVPGLTNLLRDPEWPVRRQAAISLGQIGPGAKAALADLEKLAKDPDSLVRKAAADAIKKIRIR